MQVKPVVFHPDTSGEAAVFEEANQGGLDSSSAGGDGDPRRESGTYNVPQVETKTIVFDESAPPISESDTKGKNYAYSPIRFVSVFVLLFLTGQLDDRCHMSD